MAEGGEMSQDTAQWLFELGATLVFLDVPEGTEFGIDCNSWQVGPRFKGVKMIPPGVHFIYYSAKDLKNNQFAPRTGFFHVFAEKEVLVKRWSKEMEDIKPDPISAEEQQRIEDNKKELDRFLGAYPYDSYKKWVSFTSHISPTVVSHLSPTCGKICSVTPLESQPSDSASRLSANPRPLTPPLRPTEKDLLDMKAIPGSDIQFTKILKQSYPKGSTPGEMTMHCMDSSYTLDCLLQETYQGDHLRLLGELQFAFVCFLAGQVYDGFEQWKKIVRLLCSCEQAISKHSQLYQQFIGLLHYHVREIPEDFFVDIVTSDNFLVAVLRSFFENLKESSAEATLKSRGLKFREHLEKKFKWDLSAETDDDAPVIVE